jgi:hypothetical protein
VSCYSLGAHRQTVSHFLFSIKGFLYKYGTGIPRYSTGTDSNVNTDSSQVLRLKQVTFVTHDCMSSFRYCIFFSLLYIYFPVRNCIPGIGLPVVSMSYNVI